MNDSMEDPVRLKKLKWLCRRGMKELDILLEKFMEKNELQLAEGSCPELEAFLQSGDDQLWAWIQDPARCDNRQYMGLVLSIRDGATVTH